MEEKINNIIAKRFSDQATEDDLAYLQDWLAEDEEHRLLFEELKQFWQESDRVDVPAFDTERAWQRVATRIEETPQVAKKRTIALPVWTRYTLAAAATLLIGFFVMRSLSGPEMITIAAGNANKEVVLPDDSHILLRAGSELSYPSKFEEKERMVVLSGEAFFDVAHDTEHPFVISSTAVTIKVLGTSFNARCAGRTANVSVVTGRVQMTGKSNTARSLVLTPGREGLLRENGELEETASDGNSMYWKTGLLSFSNKRLDALVADMATLTGVDISLDGQMPVPVRGQSVNISFSGQPLEEMLTELCMVAHCKWSKTANGYIISSTDK